MSSGKLKLLDNLKHSGDDGLMKSENPSLAQDATLPEVKLLLLGGFCYLISIVCYLYAKNLKSFSL